jgi:hypothetical protein
MVCRLQRAKTSGPKALRKLSVNLRYSDPKSESVEEEAG